MHYHFGPADAIPSSPPAALSSSPPPGSFLSPTRSLRGKERRMPSVTPRRFTRFFTPRSNLPGVCVDRLPLSSLDSAAVNQQSISPQSLFSDALNSDLLPSSPTQRVARGANDASKRPSPNSPTQPIKRRRGLHLDDMPLPVLRIPGDSSARPIEESRQIQEEGMEMRSAADILSDRRKATLNLFFKASRGGLRDLQEKSHPLSTDFISTERRPSLALEGYTPTPIRKFNNRGFGSQLMNREHGFSSIGGSRHLATPAADPRVHSASFYSRSCDSHMCSSYSGQGFTIPFSLASCHKAPVTAVGDEQGYVRLFNTSTEEGPVDSKVDLHVKVHDNAIMDLAFSDDDMRLATACGDRSGKILDIMTQTVAVELGGGHCDSLRQITFQPGPANGSCLATSDRAGRIQIWDLRCSPMPTQTFSSGIIHQRDTGLDAFFAKTVNTIDKAHERKTPGSTSSASSSASVTALQWLPEGREHLLLSASESNASIKLWDTRYIKPRRQAEDTPLAATPEPRSHAWRSYGITSLALSTDAARLYAVCKDSTVYAYSTSHLLLGHAPALEQGAIKRKPHGEEGMGPLFGFKHDLFRAQSFYVKCAIRPATDGSPELLAVGSSNSCAVLFPTDERYMRSSWAQQSHLLNTPSFNALPPLTPLQPTSSPFCSTPSALNGSSPTIPICKTGTPLIRGHGREVTTLSWSYDGKLVTASDDYVVRQWQEDATRARHLRTVGEFGGERHMAGWADVSTDWDADDD